MCANRSPTSLTIASCIHCTGHQTILEITIQLPRKKEHATAVHQGSLPPRSQLPPAFTAQGFLRGRTAEICVTLYHKLILIWVEGAEPVMYTNATYERVC